MAYDAWESNFVLSEKFQTFLKNSKVRGTSENKAIRFALALYNANIQESSYIKFVVVTLQHGVEGLYYKQNIQNLILEYDTWQKTSIGSLVSGKYSKEYCLTFIDVDSLLVGILEDVHCCRINAITAAEIISKHNIWDEVWNTKEDSTFVFDLVWKEVYKYKPLFKE